MYGVVGEAACARELDVVGAQHFQHFGSHQPHDQGNGIESERGGRQHQRLQSAGGEEAGGPVADGGGFATPERGQQAQPDGKDQDQEYADQEVRQRYAGERQRQQHLGSPLVAPQRRVDAERDAQQQADQRGGGGQFERGGQALDQQLRYRPAQAQRNAEVALQGIADELGELHVERCIEPQALAHFVAVGGGGFRRQHQRHRVADKIE